MSELVEDNPPEVVEEAEEPVFEKEKPKPPPKKSPEEKPKEDRPPSPGTKQNIFVTVASFELSTECTDASDKWFKQAKVIGPGKGGMSTTDTAIAFKKVSKNSTKLSFGDWHKYLNELATTKKVEVNVIKNKLVTCGEPGFTGETKVVKSAAVERLTDSSRFGGTHKERFDPNGKGKGKDGRENKKSDGYVQGYKGKKDADSKMKH